MASKARELANLGNAYSDGALSNRNLIINGAMQVAQRGTSFSVSSTGIYTLDRYNTVAGGTAFTVEQVAGFSDFGKSLKITGASGNTLAGVFQRIEAANVKHLSGKTVTLSFYAKASASMAIGVQAFYAGAEDNWSSSTSIEFNAINLTTAATRYTIVLETLPSGVTNGIAIQFGTGALTSGSFEITGVQLEVGDTATPFEHRSYGQELALCQRYYFHVGEDAFGEYTQFGQGRAYSSSNGNAIVQFPVPMRTKPTMDTGNAVAGDWDFGLTSNPTAGSVPDSFTHMTVGAAASFTNGSIFVLGANSGTGGNAQLNFDAEL